MSIRFNQLAFVISTALVCLLGMCAQSNIDKNINVYIEYKTSLDPSAEAKTYVLGSHCSFTSSLEDADAEVIITTFGGYPEASVINAEEYKKFCIGYSGVTAEFESSKIAKIVKDYRSTTNSDYSDNYTVDFGNILYDYIHNTENFGNIYDKIEIYIPYKGTLEYELVVNNIKLWLTEYMTSVNMNEQDISSTINAILSKCKYVVKNSDIGDVLTRDYSIVLMPDYISNTLRSPGEYSMKSLNEYIVLLFAYVKPLKDIDTSELYDTILQQYGNDMSLLLNQSNFQSMDEAYWENYEGFSRDYLLPIINDT